MFCENLNIATTTPATHCVPNILIQSAACLFFKSFGYFNKAAFYALSVGDSFSCVHDGTLWQTFETAMMQPLHLDKSLHCYPVKASCPRHAIVHKDHILHDCAPWTRSNPISRVIPSGENGCFLSRKATKHLILDFSHMHLISDWLFSVLGKSHGYLLELELPISTLGRFTQSLGKR